MKTVTRPQGETDLAESFHTVFRDVSRVSGTGRRCPDQGHQPPSFPRFLLLSSSPPLRPRGTIPK